MTTCRCFSLFFGFLIGLLPAAPAAAQARMQPTPAAASLKPQALAAHEYLPASALKPGMKGYGLTVFRGARIERFGVTILGVLQKVNNGKDLILVRLEGGPVTKRYANIIAGMSGSPVYVQGRIVGAVAYAPVFAREPLGFLTPIEDMLEAWDPDLPQSMSASAALPSQGGSLPTTITVGGRSFTGVRFAAPGDFTPASPGKAGDDEGMLTLAPLATPVSVSGVPLSRLSALARLLAPMGLRPSQMPGGAAGAPKGIKGSPLQPGGAIGVSLATGDLDMTATGTLTYRRGDKIVAFGHPFTGIGAIDAPMYSAYVHEILPSYQISERIGSPVSLVGRIFQDRPFSIGGLIGAAPVMVPVAIDIDDRSTKRLRHFRARILRHPLLTPRIAAFAASNAIVEVHGQPGDAMATVSLEVEAEEIGKITRTNTFFDPISIGESATGDLQSLLSTLSSNPFYPVGVRSVKMNVVIEPRRDTAQIERIFLKQGRFEPGDTVDVSVVMKPYKRERVVRNLQVRIPASAPNGPLLLMVQGGSFAPLMLAPGPGGGLVLSSGPSTSSAASIEQLVRHFVEREKNSDLVARLLLPTTAITVEGEKLTTLPPAIADVMRSTRSTGLHMERDEVKVVTPTEYVLSGLQALTIRVAKKGTPGRLLPPLPPSGGEGGAIPVAPPAGLPVAALGGDEEGVAAGPAGIDGSWEPQGENSSRALVLEEGDNLSPGPAEAGKNLAAAKAETGRPAAGDEQAKEEEDVQKASSAARDAPKPVGRLPSLWKQNSAADFRAGTMQGVTITSHGDVRLAPMLLKTAESKEAYFWSLAPDGVGGVYAGTGDNGLIYKISAEGTRTEWAKTGELEIHALLRAPDGTLYAGTSPHGRVLKIGSNGKTTLLFQTEEKYVLALTGAEDGTIYAATGGGKGRVYRISPQGKGQIVYDGKESHVTALARGPDGTVYAGTAPSGIVLKIVGPSASGKGSSHPVVLYEAGETTISGLGADKQGNVYAATAGGARGSGVLYKISPDATARVLYDKAAGALAGLQVGEDGTVWVASGATVYAAQPDETVQTYEASSDIQILSLLLAPGPKLWVSTGNVGAVYTLGSAESKGAQARRPSRRGDAPALPASGTLISSVFDAKAPAKWGTIRWTAAVPRGARILLETRTGDVDEPDQTWSAWSKAYGFAPGEKIASPRGRYLQYRATLTGSDAVAPRLSAVEVFYLTRNQPPTVTISSPRGGEVWRGSKTLRWNGLDPDKDTLSYDVALSDDSGKTWKSLRPGRAPTTVGATPPAPASATEGGDMLTRVRSELDKHAEISAEIKERILREAPDAIRDALAHSRPAAAAPEAKDVAVTTGIRDTTMPLDTTRWPDGAYLLRVIASDAVANPQEPMSAEHISGEFRIVNHPPLLLLFRKATTVMSDRSVRVEGSAMHRLVAIRAVQYRVDDGDWLAAAATDGLFDSPLEAFTIATPPLPPGAHIIEVQAQDEAGNTATQKTTVRVRG